MNNLFMQPTALRKQQMPINKQSYQVIQNPPIYSTIMNDQGNGSPVLSKIKIYTQVKGSSKSPSTSRTQIQDYNYTDQKIGFKTHRTSNQSPKEFSLSLKSHIRQNVKLSSTYQSVKDLKVTPDAQRQDGNVLGQRNLLTQLTQEIEELRSIIQENESKQVPLDSMQEVNNYIVQKLRENKYYSNLILELEAKIKSLDQEYESNLQVLSVKVDAILIENLKLKNLLQQSQQDKDEEYEYFRQKQLQFINEHHDMSKLRKDLDNEVINASQENYKKIIEIKNQEIDNLVQHIEGIRFRFNDNQKFIREQSDYQQDLRRSSRVLETENDSDLAHKYLKREINNLKQEVESEKNSKRKLERIMKDCQEHHERSTNDFENVEQLEMLIQDKQIVDNQCLYLQQELLKLTEENEQYNQEIQNLHKLLNQRNVEFQFVQKSICNDKDELLRVNQQLKDQMKIYQRDFVSKNDLSHNDQTKEIISLKQKLEFKIQDIDALKEELEYYQKEKDDDISIGARINKSQLDYVEEEDELQFIIQENKDLKQRISQLEGELLNFEESKDNIVRLVNEVISENRTNEIHSNFKGGLENPSFQFPH